MISVVLPLELGEFPFIKLLELLSFDFLIVDSCDGLLAEPVRLLIGILGPCQAALESRSSFALCDLVHVMSLPFGEHILGLLLLLSELSWYPFLRYSKRFWWSKAEANNFNSPVHVVFDEFYTKYTSKFTIINLGHLSIPEWSGSVMT